MQDNRIGFLIGGIVCLFFAIFYLIMICKNWKELKVAITVVDAAADMLRKTKRLMWVNTAFFFISIFSILIWVGGFLGLMSMGDIKANTRSIPQGKLIVYDGEQWNNSNYIPFVLVMVFGLIWIQSLISTTLNYIVMVAASSYYFDSNNEREGKARLSLGFKFAFFNNFGSLCFGSLLCSLMTFLRWTFVLIGEQMAKGSEGNHPLAGCFKACAGCMLGCCEKLTDYISERGFAYMAVSGDRFCVSCWNGFLLNLKHCAKFSFASFLAEVFIFLGKVCVTTVNTFSIYLFLRYGTGDFEEL